MAHLHQVSNISNTSSVVRTRPFTVGERPPLAGSSSSNFGQSGPIRPRPETDQGPRNSGWPGTTPLPEALTSRPKKPPQPTDEESQQIFDRMYDSIIAEEAGFVSELEKFLKNNEQLKEKKQRELYNTWESEIYENINNQIGKKVDARSARSVSNRGAAMMQEYLNVSNSKSFGMFRDIIIEAEYDPLRNRDRYIRYDSRMRHDPCKLEVRKYAESKSRAAPKAGYEKPGSRGVVPRLDSQQWDKLEATPYGRLGKLVPAVDAEPYSLANRVVTDQFNIKYGKEALARELPLGKRCFLGGPSESRQMAAILGKI